MNRQSRKRHLLSPSSVSLLLVMLSVNSHSTLAKPFKVCESDAQCLNGGTCERGFFKGRYNRCNCVIGFGGDRCEMFCPLDCQNGGVCYYIGNDEEKKAHQKKLLNDNVKSGSPHLHETDQNANDYACKCWGYFTGKFCTIPYVNCDNGTQCFFGGTCTATTVGGKTLNYCVCPEGYSGQKCITAEDGTDAIDNVAQDMITDTERKRFENSKNANLADESSTDAENSSSKRREVNIPLLVGVITIVTVLVSTMLYGYRRYKKTRYRILTPGEGAICSEPYDVRVYSKNSNEGEDPQRWRWRNIV